MRNMSIVLVQRAARRIPRLSFALGLRCLTGNGVRLPRTIAPSTVSLSQDYSFTRDVEALPTSRLTPKRGIASSAAAEQPLAAESVTITALPALGDNPGKLKHEKSEAQGASQIAKPSVNLETGEETDEDLPPEVMDALDAVPVIRPRLETHLYETLMDDILVLLYCHDSPLAPSIAALDAESETKRIESPRPAALRQVFSVPLGQLPTSPYSLNGITSNLLTAESNRQIVRPVRQGWRPVMKNPIDYTTVRKKQFARFFRRIDRNAILRARAFEKYFSPKPQHLPVVKKVSLRVWDEKAIDNKNILIGAIMSLSSITGLPATPLFSTAADAAKKIRVGMPLGAAVEVHGSRAYEFLDKLIHVVLPRLREWSGVKVELKRPFRATVQSGVIRFKIPEAAVGAFPDIEPHFDMYPRLFDLEVSIHTSAGNRRHAALLLSGMQMPIEVVETAKAEKAKSTDPFAMFRRRDRNTGRIIRAGAKAKPAKAKKK